MVLYLPLCPLVRSSSPPFLHGSPPFLSSSLHHLVTSCFLHINTPIVYAHTLIFGNCQVIGNCEIVSYSHKKTKPALLFHHLNNSVVRPHRLLACNWSTRPDFERWLWKHRRQHITGVTNNFCSLKTILGCSQLPLAHGLIDPGARGPGFCLESWNILTAYLVKSGVILTKPEMIEKRQNLRLFWRVLFHLNRVWTMSPGGSYTCLSSVEERNWVEFRGCMVIFFCLLKK